MKKNKKQAAAFLLVLLACSMECENIMLWALFSGSMLAGAAALILPGKKKSPAVLEHKRSSQKNLLFHHNSGRA